MRRGPDAEDLERQKTVLQLKSLLMAWWEGSEDELPQINAPRMLRHIISGRISLKTAQASLLIRERMII